MRLLTSYQENQLLISVIRGLFHATTYVLMIAAPVNIILNYTFVWHLGWGFIGAPIAVACTQNLLPIVLFLYVRFVDGSQCWGGFSKRALTNWGMSVSYGPL
jgi:MATE family multidrug resistance protein